MREVVAYGFGGAGNHFVAVDVGEILATRESVGGNRRNRGRDVNRHKTRIVGERTAFDCLDGQIRVAVGEIGRYDRDAEAGRRVGESRHRSISVISAADYFEIELSCIGFERHGIDESARDGSVTAQVYRRKVQTERQSVKPVCGNAVHAHNGDLVHGDGHECAVVVSHGQLNLAVVGDWFGAEFHAYGFVLNNARGSGLDDVVEERQFVIFDVEEVEGYRQFLVVADGVFVSGNRDVIGVGKRNRVDRDAVFDIAVVEDVIIYQTARRVEGLLRFVEHIMFVGHFVVAFQLERLAVYRCKHRVRIRSRVNERLCVVAAFAGKSHRPLFSHRVDFHNQSVDECVVESHNVGQSQSVVTGDKQAVLHGIGCFAPCIPHFDVIHAVGSVGQLFRKIHGRNDLCIDGNRSGVQRYDSVGIISPHGRGREHGIVDDVVGVNANVFQQSVRSVKHFLSGIDWLGATVVGINADDSEFCGTLESVIGEQFDR